MTRIRDLSLFAGARTQRQHSSRTHTKTAERNALSKNSAFRFGMQLAGTRSPVFSFQPPVGLTKELWVGTGNWQLLASKSLKLLDFYGGDAFELLLDGLGVFLAHVLLQRLRSAVHQVLGFLQTQGGDFAHRLDRADLVRARILQDDGELGLLHCLRGRRPRASAGNHHRGRRRRRNAKALFELLHQGRRVQKAKPDNLIFQLLYVRHVFLQTKLNFYFYFRIQVPPSFRVVYRERVRYTTLRLPPAHVLKFPMRPDRRPSDRC